MTAAMVGDRNWMSIGEVLSLLNRDFPDISISKIRFLETEGLISPQRAKSGYRRFADEDIDQLRLVLVAQRDRYLPLRVIKDHLASGTLHDVVYPQSQVEVQVLAAEPREIGEVSEASESRIRDINPTAVFSRSELAEQSGLTTAQVDELIKASVIAMDPAGRFTGADVHICRAYAVLVTFGVDDRHMRQSKNTASRESFLIGNAIGHLTGDERTEAVGQMLDALSDAHYWLVMADLNRQTPSAGQRRRRRTR